MLPQEFECIAGDLVSRYKSFLDDDPDGVEFSDFLSVEEQVVDFVHNLGLGMLQVFVDIRAEQSKTGRRACGCGRVPGIHRTTKWTRKTLLGPVVVRDPYVYCPGCHESWRPLHSYLGTQRETWSLTVQEAAVDLATDEACGKAVDKLARHHPGVEMERTTALRLLHKHGESARAFINDKLSKARDLAELPSGFFSGGADEVQFDGGMIPVATLEPVEVLEGTEPELTPVRGLHKRRRACRWEEAKVGLVQRPGEVERLYTVQPTSGLSRSFDDLFALACMKGWNEQTSVRGIADGARHIRPRLAEAFNACYFRFILDRPHCKQHLSEAGEALEPATGEPAQQWADAALKKLEVGEVGSVVKELLWAWETSGADKKSRCNTLRREALYFKRNQDAVAYAEYRKQKWSTASSEVESAHRHVVQIRVKISGAWWHPEHVDDILALRMLKANGWWQGYWEAQKSRWKKRAMQFTGLN